MATALYLTSDGCRITITHYNPDVDVYPTILVDFSLSASLQLSITYRDSGADDGYGGFNYKMGFIASGANNSGSLQKTDWLRFGNPSGLDYGFGNSMTLTADLSSYQFPISIDLICAGCDHAHSNPNDKVPVDFADNSGNLIIYDNRHTHIDPPAAPKIKSTTGTTITVENGEDGLYCTTNNKGWYHTPHTFLGLTQGTNYSFKCKKICPDCPDNKVYESELVTGKTWNISGAHVGSGAKTMVFKATHVAGTGGNVNAHTITYELYKSKNTSGDKVASKTGNNGIPVTFTDLEPGTTYYCHAFTTNLGNGDNNCWIEAGTKNEIVIQSSTGDVSATTLRTTVSWNAGGATSVNCYIKCNEQSESINSSGKYVGFIGLTPGVTYQVSWKVVSTYIYTYTYTIINEDGEKEEKEGTITDVLETYGSNVYTTKQTKFGTPINITSKIIQFKSTSNYPSDVMEQTINSNSNWDSTEQDTYVIYNNLTHNTSYTIYARIAGCYAFTETGAITSTNDSVINKTVSTKLLSLAGSISEEHQHSLVTLWQAYVDGVATNIDAIDGTSFGFTYMDTIAQKNNPPYQSAEVINASNGNTTGNYQLDKKIYSNNLTWYYCEYIVTASLTDGFNVVGAAVVAHTIFPAAWIFSGGQWHRYMGYVYTNGKYVPAPAFIYKNNKYNEPNGE